MQTYTTIDEYIQECPESIQESLSQLRKLIHTTAPDAVETIRYGIPTFQLSGKNLVHFAGYKNHIGFYPAPSGIEKFNDEVTRYKAGKGTLQFPLDEPLPFDLITRIVQFRVQEILGSNK